jgi:hypothetical protein
MIQKGMEFDAAFGAAADSPGEQRQTEAHHCGTEAMELVFELEFVLRGQRLPAPVHQTQQRLKEGGGALVVGVGKGGAGHRLDSQVVETPDASFQAGDAISQTDSSRELHGEQVHQLAPPRERPGLPAGALLSFQFGKMMSRNKFKHLMKNCVTVGHSPKSPFCLVSYMQTHSNRFREISVFYNQLTGQH